MLLRSIVEALGKRTSRRPRNKKYRKQQQEQNQRSQRESMPLAYALARSWAWPALQFRCKTHPQEVSQISKDSRGETILHWTCIGKPPFETVQAILAVCPEMAQERNHAGHLPLHVAISYRANSAVVRALLEAFPESAGSMNGAGAYPLHLACDYGSCVDSLSAILETSEGAATISKTMGVSQPLTALNVLTSRMNYPVFRRAIHSMREARKRQRATRETLLQRTQQQCERINETGATPSREAAGQDDVGASNSNENSAAAAFDRNERMISSFQQNDYWQKAALLALVSYSRQPLSPNGLEDKDANLVHACAGNSDCPSYLLEFAILLHMDDLIERRDRQGRLPLHIAAEKHAASLMAASMTNNLQRKVDEALLMILDACPAAAHAQDQGGNLPLAVAIHEIQRSSGEGIFPEDRIKAWSRGLQRLLDANLEALESLNLDAWLYPWLWGSKRITSVDQLFQSVRRHPDLFDQKGSRFTETADC